jgi:predicted MFS family arabinose efflux permease
MSAGPAAASAIAYGVAALFGDNWKLPFFILGALLLFSVVLYTVSVNIVAKFPKDMSTHHIVMSDGTEADVSDEEDNDFIHLNSKRRVAVFYTVSIFIGFFLTSIYFMVNNNLDVYLKEIGGFSNSIAKILTVFAPLAAVVGPLVCVRSCERHRNFVAVAAVYFGLALAVMTAVLFVFDKSVIAALALMVLFLVLANGGRSVSLSIAALKMRTKIDTGVYSTVVNAVGSIASGVTPKIITSILDRESLSVTESWRMSLGIIFAVNLFAVVALMLIIIWIKLANRKGRQTNEISEEN